MTNNTFNVARTNATRRHAKAVDATEIAARYFVDKLYEVTGGYPMQWAVLHGIDESAATVSGAVERGWVVLQEVAGKPLDRKAALTDDGRWLARNRDLAVAAVDEPGGERLGAVRSRATA
jgi:hypothetical protein